MRRHLAHSQRWTSPSKDPLQLAIFGVDTLFDQKLMTMKPMKEWNIPKASG